METYVILRRGVWREGAALAVARAGWVTQADPDDDVTWIRSYVLEERDGRIGTVCVYRASSPEAVRRHSRAVRLPVDEIVRVADTVVHPNAVAATS